MDAHTRNLPLSSIGANFPHENLDAFWGPYASAESAMVYPVPAGQGFAQGIIPENYRVPGLKFGVKVMNGSQLVRVEEYQVTGVQTYKKLILTEDDINLPQDIAEVFVCHNNAQDYGDLNAAVQAGKIIMWEGNVVNIKHNSTQGVYRLSYVGGDGLVHCYNVFSSSPSAATKENIPLARADEYLYYGSGTTFVELNSWVSSHKPVKVNGYVANVVQDSQTQYTLKYVDGDGVLYIITHDSSNTKTTTTKDLSASVHVEADNSTKVFAIKDNRGTTIGNITLSTAASGAAVLAFADNVNGSFVATLPNLRYDSATQMLKMVDAGENETNLIKLSNLQIKYVGSTDPSTGTWALGDLILVGNDNDGYELKVYTGSAWSPLGSINNVSLQADQVTLNSTKLSSTDVKGGLEELYDKVDGVGASYWTGSIGISTETSYSNVSGLTEYNKQSEPIDVYVTAVGYLWIVSSVKIIAETSGIEIPMLAPVKSGDFYYYRSEEVVKDTISVMVKALAKQEGTDPNDNITISGDALTTITKTAGDAYVTLSLPTITSNNGGILSYQWEKEGQAISGANSQTYEVGGTNQDQELVESDSGYYRCKITNSLGGYEYTKGTILEVTASQGGGGEGGDSVIPSGEGWTMNAVIKKENSNDEKGKMVENENYMVFSFAINHVDDYIVHVGYNSADYLTVVPVTGWVNLNDTYWRNSWFINHHARIIRMNSTDSSACNYLRVVFSKNNVNKGFIYNRSAAERGENPWIYKGSEFDNHTDYNNLLFFYYSVGNSGTFNNVIKTQYSSSFTDNALYYTPTIKIPDEIFDITKNCDDTNTQYWITVCTGSNITNYTKFVSCNSDGTIKTTSSATRYLSSQSDPRSVKVHSDMQYIRIFPQADYLHTSYLLLHTEDHSYEQYLWKGIDVPTLNNN